MDMCSWQFFPLGKGGAKQLREVVNLCPGPGGPDILRAGCASDFHAQTGGLKLSMPISNA